MPTPAPDPDFRARFTREARAVSAFNYPHICSLYDVGREHDTDYLVLELLDGETLQAPLQRGALPLNDVLRFGVEIAGALAAAHLHGIVLRDLKPGNVLITRGGTKLLDLRRSSRRFMTRPPRFCALYAFGPFPTRCPAVRRSVEESDR